MVSALQALVLLLVVVIGQAAEVSETVGLQSQRHHHRRHRRFHDHDHEDQYTPSHSFKQHRLYHEMNKYHNLKRLLRLETLEQQMAMGDLDRQFTEDYHRLRSLTKVSLANLPAANQPKSNVFDLVNNGPVAPGTTAFAAQVHLPANYAAPQAGKYPRCYIASCITRPVSEAVLTAFIQKLGEEGFQDATTNPQAPVGADGSVAAANGRLGMIFNANFYLDLPTETASDGHSLVAANYQTLYNTKVASINTMTNWFNNQYAGQLQGVGSNGKITRQNGDMEIHLAAIGSAWLPRVVADADYANIPKLGNVGGNYPKVAQGTDFPWEPLLGAIEADMGRAAGQEQFISPNVRNLGKALSVRNTYATRDYFRRLVPYGALRNANLASAQLTTLLTSMNAACNEIWIHSIDSDSNGFTDAQGDGIYTRYDRLLANNQNAIYAVGGIQLTIANANAAPANGYTADEQAITNMLFEWDRQVKHEMAASASGLLLLPQEPNFILKCPGANPPTSPVERFQTTVPEGAGIRTALLAGGGRLDPATPNGVQVAAWYRARAVWDQGCYLKSETPERFLEQTHTVLTGQGKLAVRNTMNNGKIDRWRVKDIGNHIGNMEQLTMSSDKIAAAGAIFSERIMGANSWGNNFNNAKTAIGKMSRLFSVRTYLGTQCSANTNAGSTFEAQLATAITAGNPSSPYETALAQINLAPFPQWNGGNNPYTAVALGVGASDDLTWKQYIAAQANNALLGDMDAALRQGIKDGNLKLEQLLQANLVIVNNAANNPVACNAAQGPVYPGAW